MLQTTIHPRFEEDSNRRGALIPKPENFSCINNNKKFSYLKVYKRAADKNEGFGEYLTLYFSTEDSS